LRHPLEECNGDYIRRTAQRVVQARVDIRFKCIQVLPNYVYDSAENSDVDGFLL
jgi:hypothetical protein